MIFCQSKDKYGDVMTIEEFEETVDCGAFIPDDGIGFYGTDTHYTYEGSVWSTQPPEGATHVHWYNR